MLVIERKVGEWVKVGDAVIHIGRMKGGSKVRLIIDAPGTRVERGELSRAMRTQSLEPSSSQDVQAPAA